MTDNSYFFRYFAKKLMLYPFKVIFTIIYYGCFNILLGIFHPIQVVCYKLGGSKAQQRSVDVLNYLLIKCFFFLGAKVKFEGFEKLPTDRPLIIISNHQSTVDIPAVVVGFRKNHAKFISKIELSKGLPSISFNLRVGGSALIDRSKGSAAIKEIYKLGERIEANNWSACIFPEGTRSRDGHLKEFQTGGIKTLLKAAPNALIVPFCIKGHYDLQKNGNLPLTFGCKLTYSVLEPMEQKNLTAEEITSLTYDQIKNKLEA